MSVVCVCFKNSFQRCNWPPFAIYSSEEPDATKAKGDEEEEEYSLADIAEGSVTSVRIRGAGWQNNPREITALYKNQLFQIKYFTTCLNRRT